MTTETVATETTATPEIASERGLLVAMLLMVSLGATAMFFMVG